MADSESAPTSPQQILERLRRGEFFRESRLIYHQRYHDIMAERYLYLIVTGVSLVILFFSVIAVNMFFPLKTNVPFIYTTSDIVNDVPRMQIIGEPGRDANLVLREFLASTYVRMREEYNIDKIDLNVSGVRNQSVPEVFNTYQASLDPQNPASPIAKYQRRATRTIRVADIKPISSDMNQMQVRYEATVTEGVAVRKERGLVNITFRFKDIQVNQTSGATTPLEFTVTAYSSTPVQE